MEKILIGVIVFSTSVCSLYSQNKTIKGRVIAENFETMAGVLLMINDTVEVGTTDVNGFFQLEIPISKEKLLFKAVGLKSTNIVLVDKCDKIELVMMYSFTYDFISLKRVERKERKRVKKLPKIHKQALEKGIFEFGNICYTREFEP